MHAPMYLCAYVYKLGSVIKFILQFLKIDFCREMHSSHVYVCAFKLISRQKSIAIQRIVHPIFETEFTRYYFP